MSVVADLDLTLRRLDPAADAAMLHAWVTHPKAVFWMMQDATVADVASAYAAIDADQHHDAYVGLADGEPAFLVERYLPAHSELAGLGAWTAADLGMHVLVAPTDDPVTGFTAAVMRTTMRFCFADPDVDRVVVEPDVRNDRIAVLNADAGFVVDRLVELRGKTAALSTCTRAQFEASRLGGTA